MAIKNPGLPQKESLSPPKTKLLFQPLNVKIPVDWLRRKEGIQLANTKSAAKRVKTNLKRYDRNRSIKSMVKNTTRDFQDLVKKADAGEAQKALARAYRVIDKAVSRGVLHKNTASRKKSQLSRMLGREKAL